MENSSVAWRLLLFLVSGLFLSGAYWGPVGSSWAGCAWLGVIFLVLQSTRERPRVAALGGFLSGLVFFGITLRWIYVVMRDQGSVPPAAAVAIVGLLVAALALHWAAFSLCVGWLGQRSVGRACLAAPFLWVVFEFAHRHSILGGFPWNLLGYATGDGLALLQVSTLTGIYGLSFLIAAWCALVVWAWSRLKPLGRGGRAVGSFLIVLSLLMPLFLGFADRWVPEGKPQHVARLVQTNFPESLSYPSDWWETHAGEIDQLERLSISGVKDAAGPVIWPEVPAPFSFQDARFAERAERMAREAGRPFLVGVVDWKPGPNGGLEPYNSAVLLDASGRRVFLYDKIHLVPFGEYVPLRRWLRFARSVVLLVGEFQAGTVYRVGELPGNARFGVFICYEAVFPDEVRRFVAGGAQLLINISNDGWFGRSAAPAQHLTMARVRAVENRRWLLRSTNNGYTVVVDPYGRITARLPADVRDALDAPYGLRSDLTPYARWGDWFAWLCVVVSIGTLVAGRRRQ